MGTERRELPLTEGTHLRNGRFVRDRFTWLAYLLLASFTLLQAILGPLMPFLRAELHLSYTVGGLHLSAFAAGMVLAGLTGDRVLSAMRRGLVFWGGAAGMALGACLLALDGHVLVTLAAALIMGTAGALMLVTIQAALSDHHGDARAIAFTEANVLGGVSAGLGPLLVAGFQQLGPGWHGALYAIAAGLALLVAGFGRQPVPDVPRTAPGVGLPGRRLPAAYWAYWVVILLGVAIEFCLIGWGAEFLATVVGLAQNAAVAVMSIFFLAMVLGRLAGSRLAHTIAARKLLFVSIGVAAGGFPLFWLAPVPLLNVAGLFVTGLGVGNLFPLTLSVALAVAPGQTDAASARMTLGAGLAVLAAPLTLGWLADRIGIAAAYGATFVIIAAAVGMIALANRLAARGV